MRVEVRRRAGGDTDAVAPLLNQPRSSNPDGVIEAYNDGAFQPIRFFVVSPDHPNLGKWAQPSTLKYSLPPQAKNFTNESPLDETNHPVATRSRPRPVFSSPDGRSYRRRTSSAVSNGRSSRVRRKTESGRAERPVSPVPTLGEGSGSLSLFSVRGGREGLRVDMPISGRVVSLHHRSFQASPLPSSPTLRGSFAYQRKEPTTATSNDHNDLDYSKWLAAANQDHQGKPSSPHAQTNRYVSNAETSHHEKEVFQSRNDGDAEVDPGFRYRVKLEGVSFVGSKQERRACRNCEEHHVNAPSPGQVTLLPLVTPAPPPPLDLQASPWAVRKQPIIPVGNGTAGRLGDVDLWAASEVDPFLLALRNNLLRDRPADVPAYVSVFSNCWREET